MTLLFILASDCSLSSFPTTTCISDMPDNVLNEFSIVENAFMYRLLGYRYFEVGNYTKGTEYLDKFFAIAEAKGKPTIVGNDYAYKGKLLSKTGQDSLALDFLKMAIEKDAEYIDGYSDVAALYFRHKNYAEAAS